jgi:hypothetical protein
LQHRGVEQMRNEWIQDLQFRVRCVC